MVEEGSEGRGEEEGESRDDTTGQERVLSKGGTMSKPGRFPYVVLCASLALLFAHEVSFGAGWETGIRAGFDTDVNRSVTDKKSDGYLLAHLSYEKEYSDLSRLGYSLGASIEGSAYNRYRDLSYGRVSVSPSIIYHLHRLVSLSLSPHVGGTVMGDQDQSAFEGGIKFTIREQITPRLYAGQYYHLRASSADSNVYSFTENALGLFLGARITSLIGGELGYEFSRGDSYRTASVGLGVRKGAGAGRRQRYSTVFNEMIFREEVDRHAVGAVAAIDLSGSLSGSVSFTYTSLKGNTGSSTARSGLIGLDYRF